jgi:energy-coupling factor transporter ATP-binding protein EcfA2
LGVEIESQDPKSQKVSNGSSKVLEKAPEEINNRINKKVKEKDAVSDKQFFSEDKKNYRGFASITAPWDLSSSLASVGYECLPYLAVQISLFVVTPSEAKVRALMLEGPSGCGKSFLAKSLAKITDAELMVLSCYQGMATQNLIEAPSSFALASAMAKGGGELASELMNLGIITRAFLRSKEHPVILLVDELDKPDSAIDTFFLGPLQDATVYLESRPPVQANPENIIVIFTKNFNRKIDEALLRRCHPIKMTYLDSSLETKILSKHCEPRLVANLVSVADRMRHSGGTYGFERPPAPEELLLAGHYVMKLLLWGIHDFAVVAQSIWSIVAKSEHDRAVLEHMMRFHPDFMDPLIPDPKNATFEDVLRRFGRVVLEGIVADPDEERRKKAWESDGF